ncbi:Ferredoxin--NADP reductase [Rhodospirillaceae bacterium LM-1]|nr:Ferredoxin--NADP reductase [Rhodospirillaceae bacterium LM-1]
MSETFPGVIVIGAGPVGLFTAFALGMARMKALLVDALPAPGGQCAALYPEKPIYDIPAQPMILGAELIERLVSQAEPFDPAYHMNQRAQQLLACEGGWRLETEGGLVLTAPAVIIASGAGAFGPKRPPLEGLEQFEGISVHYMVKRAADLAGKRIAIAGGGDSAVDWAILLAKTAAKVWLIHRRPQFRAAGSSIDTLMALVAEGKIELVAPGQLAELKGESGRLSEVVIDDLAGGRKSLDADTLLCFFGLLGDPGAVASWGLEMQNGRIKTDPATMATSLPGVFAVGDIATYPGKLKLILTGFAEAALAARSAYGHVFPGQSLHEVHSTSLGLPGKTGP